MINLDKSAGAMPCWKPTAEGLNPALVISCDNMYQFVVSSVQSWHWIYKFAKHPFLLLPLLIEGEKSQKIVFSPPWMQPSHLPIYVALPLHKWNLMKPMTNSVQEHCFHNQPTANQTKGMERKSHSCRKQMSSQPPPLKSVCKLSARRRSSLVDFWWRDLPY